MPFQLSAEQFTYYDLRKRAKSSNIDLLFPSWGKGEKLAIFSPHDDDGVLGAAYATLAAVANGAEAYLFIFCQGNFGYSKPELRDEIVEIRKKETVDAYTYLGIPAGNIYRFEYPDFSVMPYVGWNVDAVQAGTFAKTLPLLRELGITRLLLPNPHREHLDHEAVAKEGAYCAPQAGDPIVVDIAPPVSIKSVHTYSVWAEFAPTDALVNGRPSDVRANMAVKGSPDVEEHIAESLRRFTSQLQIIEGLIELRKERAYKDGYIELYLEFDPRPKLNFAPYKTALNAIDDAVTG